MPEAVLIVDDDANLLSSMRRQLRGKYELMMAQGGEEALGLLRQGPVPAVILCDMRMGGMDGIETLSRVKEISPETVRVMLTGNADMQTAVDAINTGAIFRFLTKPCPHEVLVSGLDAAIAQYRLITAERDLLEKTLAGSIKVLVDMLAMAYPQGYSRATRIRGWVRKLNALSNMPHRWQLDLAAILAPLGMISLPPEVLEKVHRGQPLSEAEATLVDRAPELARNVIGNIPRMGGVAQLVYLQNRGYDGSGFPADGPQGDDLPVDARILKILNDLSAISSAMMPSKIDFTVLELNAGRYDPFLLKKVRAGLENNDAGRTATTHLSTAVLLPGMDLARDVVAVNGRLVLAGLVPLSEAHIERLRTLAKLKLIEDSVVVFIDDKVVTRD